MLPGVCATGTQSCVGALFSACSILPSEERCDGLDNDCDTSTDETFPTLGDDCDGGDADACRTGETVCASNGATVVCDEMGAGNFEACNGADDDCDVTVDEGNPGGGGLCGSSVGECRTGTVSCTGGALVCAGEVTAVPEICDARNNDCDGDGADEDFACVQGATTTCNTACGTPGSHTCTSTCTLPTCLAAAETCNYCDDNGVSGTLDERSLATATVNRRFNTCADVVVHGTGATCTDGSVSSTVYLVDGGNQARGYALAAPVQLGYGLVTINATVNAYTAATTYPGRGWSLVFYRQTGASFLGSDPGMIGVNENREGIAAEWRFYSGICCSMDQTDNVVLRRIDGDGVPTTAYGPFAGTPLSTLQLNSGSPGIRMGMELVIEPDDPDTASDETGVSLYTVDAGDTAGASLEAFCNQSSAFAPCGFTLRPGDLFEVGVTSRTTSANAARIEAPEGTGASGIGHALRVVVEGACP